jgi:hypothetical protein
MMTPTTSPNAIVRAGRSSLQWRLLLLWTLCLLIPTAVLTLPMWHMLGASMDHSVHAARLAHELDLTAITDLFAAHGRHAAAFKNAMTVALILTLLLSPFLSGLVVTAARGDRTLGMRALVTGALQEYPRMLRMLLWAVIPLGLAALIGGALVDAADQQLASAIVETDVRLASLGALLGFGLLLMLAHASLDAGRAALALDRRRASAIKAWWMGCRMLVQRPWASLGVYLGISMVGLLVAALLSFARIHVPHVSTLGLIGAFVLTQLVVVTLAWMRSARLFALIDVARDARL